MKDRPILMSGPMVRAILAGTKTQTRRVVKPQPPADWDRNCWYSAPVWGWTRNELPSAEWHKVRCPYGQPGDRLWVREAWAKTQPAQLPWPQTMIVYRECDNRTDYGGPWKPSIHMPRAASRITLEVTGVRVERLQDISEADAQAEGIERLPDPAIAGGWSGPFRFTLKGMGAGACAGHVSWNAPTATELYQRLWESINGPGSWGANPWVWVVEFRRGQQ